MPRLGPELERALQDLPADRRQLFEARADRWLPDLDAALAETLPFRTPLDQGMTHVLLLRTRRADDPVKPPWRSGDLLARALLTRSAPGAAKAWRTRYERQLADEADLPTRFADTVATLRPPAGTAAVSQLETDETALHEAVEVGRAVAAAAFGRP